MPEGSGTSGGQNCTTNSENHYSQNNHGLLNGYNMRNLQDSLPVVGTPHKGYQPTTYANSKLYSNSLSYGNPHYNDFIPVASYGTNVNANALNHNTGLNTSAVNYGINQNTAAGNHLYQYAPTLNLMEFDANADKIRAVHKVMNEQQVLYPANNVPNAVADSHCVGIDDMLSMSFEYRQSNAAQGVPMQARPRTPILTPSPYQPLVPHAYNNYCRMPSNVVLSGPRAPAGTNIIPAVPSMNIVGKNVNNMETFGDENGSNYINRETVEAVMNRQQLSKKAPKPGGFRGSDFVKLSDINALNVSHLSENSVPLSSGYLLEDIAEPHLAVSNVQNQLVSSKNDAVNHNAVALTPYEHSCNSLETSGKRLPMPGGISPSQNNVGVLKAKNNETWKRYDVSDGLSDKVGHYRVAGRPLSSHANHSSDVLSSSPSVQSLNCVADNSSTHESGYRSDISINKCTSLSSLSSVASSESLVNSPVHKHSTNGDNTPRTVLPTVPEKVSSLQHQSSCLSQSHSSLLYQSPQLSQSHLSLSSIDSSYSVISSSSNQSASFVKVTSNIPSDSGNMIGSTY